MYPRHTSNCRGVGRLRSPQSLTHVSSWGLSHLPPSCNSNYLGYMFCVGVRKFPNYLAGHFPVFF
ncbi:hypothetical protein CBW52_00985 [Yersinia kristensenii]|uniref:Uncharacterized protein n=1 Tax=Yersinia kristensenii TaxID=28152 RepID=A0AB73QQ56_YERKR|nr:hypothetical protein CBW52_00985 [Yersinia kristensenii]